MLLKRGQGSAYPFMSLSRRPTSRGFHALEPRSRETSTRTLDVLPSIEKTLDMPHAASNTCPFSLSVSRGTRVNKVILHGRAT
jgi:hypothetical protein